MKTLDQLSIEHGCDKGSTHPVKGHDYARHYEASFGHLRNDPIKLLEVGVGGGESIRMWLEAFPKAEVIGIDIIDDTNDWNSPQSKPDSRYTFVTGDQSSEQFWIEFVAAHGSGWDVLIEDGSHMAWHVIPCFNFMWPHIKSGGCYSVEDLGVCYGAGSVFCNSDWPNHMDWLRGKLDDMNCGRGDIDSTIFSRELCILKKK